MTKVKISLLLAALLYSTVSWSAEVTIGPPNVDAQGNVKVNVISGGGTGGTSSTFGAAFPGTGTAAGAKFGANMVPINADAAGNLNINCAVGCAGGVASNATSGQATSTTNGQTNAWLYLFNGTTWDQAQADGAKNLKIVVNAALPTGTNNIGQVTTAPVAGTFTDRSGSVTTGSTSQQLMAANATRKSIIIENPCTAAGQGITTAENIFINFTAAAGVNTGTSLELLPCGALNPVGTVSTEAVNVTAATSGHKWIAKEM